MKVDLLGAKCLPSAGPIDQAVVPLVGLPSASVQSKAAPPQSWTSIPRCFLYHSHSAFGSLALMKMPPMPVTLRIRTSEVGSASPLLLRPFRHQLPQGRHRDRRRLVRHGPALRDLIERVAERRHRLEQPPGP